MHKSIIMIRYRESEFWNRNIEISAQWVGGFSGVFTYSSKFVVFLYVQVTIFFLSSYDSDAY